MTAAADRLAAVCRVTRLPPSEVRTLTVTEIEAFLRLAEKEADRTRRRR